MFAPATKKKSKLRAALIGPSGSGKTWSALALATGLGGKIAVIDTEHSSASLYSDVFNFDVAELEPPFSPDKYVRAIQEAKEKEYDVLNIDSLSHAWAGEGGLLEQVDARSQSGANKFTAWGPATKQQNQLINAILSFPGHVIATIRAKNEFVLEQNEKGKSVPRKVGMAPVQREGVEYEFALVLDIGMDHLARVGLSGKDRTRIFVDREPAKLTAEDGKRLAQWLENGEVAPQPVEPPKESVDPATYAEFEEWLKTEPSMNQVNDFLPMLSSTNPKMNKPTRQSIWVKLILPYAQSKGTYWSDESKSFIAKSLFPSNVA